MLNGVIKSWFMEKVTVTVFLAAVSEAFLREEYWQFFLPPQSGELLIRLTASGFSLRLTDQCSPSNKREGEKSICKTLSASPLIACQYEGLLWHARLTFIIHACLLFYLSHVIALIYFFPQLVFSTFLITKIPPKILI